jgi:hypothetical protein
MLPFSSMLPSLSNASAFLSGDGSLLSLEKKPG